MNKKEFEKKVLEKQQEHQLNTFNANKNRAHALTIGSSGSGTTEIAMRGEAGDFLWNTYSPVQVVEYIHQLAASVGCHIHIQPRKDFASWRVWEEPTAEERKHLNGFSPFAKEIPNAHKVGLKHNPATNLKIEPKIEAKEKQNAVATKKAVNERSTKRSRTTPK